MESVNIGHLQPIMIGQQPKPSGIDKRPASGPVRVGPLGLDGDHIGDARHHGGLDQAVYVYSRTDYDVWAVMLGFTPSAGLFGENLTLTDFGTDPVRIGDRYRVGGVLLEVSAPRIPCATLAARMNDPQFVRTFTQARRPGFYTRVLEPGEISAGDAVQVRSAPHDAPTVMEMFDAFYDRQTPRDVLARMLRFPVAERARADFETRLNS